MKPHDILTALTGDIRDAHPDVQDALVSLGLATRIHGTVSPWISLTESGSALATKISNDVDFARTLAALFYELVIKHATLFGPPPSSDAGAGK